MVATIAVAVTLPSPFPDSVVCVLQGNMGLPGLSGNPGPLGRKVGFVSVLGLGHGLASKLDLQAEASWATCDSWLWLSSLGTEPMGKR